MEKRSLIQNGTSDISVLDIGFEAQLLANQLVSEVHKQKGHISFTFTDAGVLAFAKAMQMVAKEEIIRKEEKERGSVFPNTDESLISKKEVMEGLGVSHTTLWKWQCLKYLVPLKVGRKVYYRRSDIERLTKST